jgi:hypothetical protein
MRSTTKRGIRRSRQGTGLPDKTVQAVVAANEANQTAEDPDHKVRFLLSYGQTSSSLCMTA